MDQKALIAFAEEQLKSFGVFLDSNDKKLQRLLQRQQQYASPRRNMPQTDVIAINYCANTEQLSLLRLLDSDRVLNKTLLTFAHVCVCSFELVDEARRLQHQFLYIDEDLCTAPDTESENEAKQQSNERILLKMSQAMEFLCNVQFLLQRCIVVGNNILHQCGALFACEDSALEFRLFSVFDALSELLLHVLIFDEILSASNFGRHWSSYKKTVESLAHNRSALECCTSSEMNGLNNCLQGIEFLFSKTIFRSFLDSTFALKEKIGPKGMGALIQQCNEYMKQQLIVIDAYKSADLDDFAEPQLLIRMNALCVLFHEFCGQVDGKHVKHLLELNVKHQGIMLIANITWEPALFLGHHAPTLVKAHSKLLHEVQRQRKHFISARLQVLKRDCRAQVVQAALWSMQVRKMLGLGAFDLGVEQFKHLSQMLLQGLRQAGQLSFVAKALISGHVLQQTPMARQTLLAVCKLIETLKLIQETYQRHAAQIARVMQCILQYLQYKVLHLLASCKKRITSAKLHDRNVDALAAIKIAEKCLHGPPTRQRLLVARLALDATNNSNRTLPPEQQQRFNTLMERIDLLCGFQTHVRRVCAATFLYWHQSMLTAYLRQIVDRKLDLHTFAYMIKASNDCSDALDALQDDSSPTLQLTQLLKRSNYDNLRSEILSGLCARIETFLRLEVHTNLQLERMSPFDQGINDYRDLIAACPIVLDGHYVVLKDHVENYLSAMFYNLTTISLHDWKTYEQMRHLAKSRLALRAVDDYLPNQTLEQGIDILEIMRKIHIFVSQYVYNMNSQIFVERQSASKHLDSIGIRHVANSLRTHGTGVINTTVNFTYQFLRQKFYTFSQFLYDDQIKSRLMKELRSYAERKQANSEPLYPYERAEAFNKDIRKLGLSTDGQTYMDLFRRVITHVGNAMGYIRLVRSGSIDANYSASLFLPKFDEHLQFVEKCKQLQAHESLIQAAENFELNVNNLVKSFSDSTDYFKLLVDAFEPFFRNPHNLHLKNFFLIVPALTVNFVQHMLSVKEKINKRDKQEALLFDDGFAVGLAYILRLLNQINDFNSLQWFATIRERFQAERRKIQVMLADIKGSKGGTASASMAASTSAGVSAAQQKSENEKLQQTLALTERRINAHQNEYNLLYYNLGSAKIFFQ